MNYSEQREEILSFLKNTKSHPTANEIYLHVKTKMPRISQGTVYRNLTQLVQHGIVLQLDDKTGNYRYDADISLHAHFKCVCCGKFEDIFSEMLQKLSASISKSHHCQVLNGQLVFEGKCNDCITKEEHDKTRIQ